MVELSPGAQLLLLGGAAILIRVLDRRERTLPTPAVAAVMAIGIFILAALQQIPPISWTTEFLTIALLVIWASMAASYAILALGDGLGQHTLPLVARFAIGTWVAGTAVLARVILKGVPEWQPLAIVLATFAFVMWVWFLKLALSVFPELAKTSERKLIPGVVLLSTVSTQSIVLVALDFLPSGPLLLWTTAILIGAGAVFYAVGLILIVRSHIRVTGWMLSDDWDNTNCILHGAMSITGLALASHPVTPAWITVPVWYYVLGMFLVVEGIEILRLSKRVRRYGWRSGVFSYRVTQWSRNFTFGMFYAFTLQLSNVAQLSGGTGWTTALRASILDFGPYIVLAFLIVEIALYCVGRFQGAHFSATNPWSRNPFIRRGPPPT